MITDFILKKLSFEYVTYDRLLSGIHYNFNHPTKGKFTALLRDKHTNVEIDSIDLSINLIFNSIHDLEEWITN